MAAQKHKPIEITFTDITDKNVEQLRKLNLAIFPVRYNDKFYQIDVLKPEQPMSSNWACLLTMMIGIQIFIEVLLSSSISFFFGLF
jgi:hypothetical protein